MLKSLQEITQRVKQLEEENAQLVEQLNEQKTTCEMQLSLIDEKDNLLEQIKEKNNSLQARITEFEQKMDKPAATAMDTSGSGNLWEELRGHGDEPDQFKMLYVGNMSYDTAEEDLRNYFEEFGEVVGVTIKKNPQSNKSRGFGFIMFKSAEMVDNAQENRPHELAGRKLDTQRALAKDAGNHEKIGRTTGLFVGGINRDTSESQIREYFGKFGEIKSVVMPTYKDTGKAKGFSFVNFNDYDIVDKLVLMKHHMIGGSRTEVKRGLPRDLQEKRHRYQGEGMRAYAQFDGGLDDVPDPGQAEALAAYFATLAKTVTSRGGFRGRGNTRPMRGNLFNQRGPGPYSYGRTRGGPRMY